MKKVPVNLSLPERLLERVNTSLNDIDYLKWRYKGNRNEFIEDAIDFYINVWKKKPIVGPLDAVFYTLILTEDMWQKVVGHLNVKKNIKSVSQVFERLLESKKD